MGFGWLAVLEGVGDRGDRLTYDFTNWWEGEERGKGGYAPRFSPEKQPKTGRWARRGFQN